MLNETEVDKIVDRAVQQPNNTETGRVEQGLRKTVLTHTSGLFDEITKDCQKPRNKPNYYCQRCQNHGLQHSRKGHKQYCRYVDCDCSLCEMVSERRRLNNAISCKGAIDDDDDDDDLEEEGDERRPNEPYKARIPKCARCAAHGEKKRLLGHKRRCPYVTCVCEMCTLVEKRRQVMAKQIKIRRQQKVVVDCNEKPSEQMITQPLFVQNIPTVPFNGTNGVPNVVPEYHKSPRTFQSLMYPNVLQSVCPNQHAHCMREFQEKLQQELKMAQLMQLASRYYARTGRPGCQQPPNPTPSPSSPLDLTKSVRLVSKFGGLNLPMKSD